MSVRHVAYPPLEVPVRPRPWWQSAGVWTCVLAAVHVATTPMFYGDSVRSVLDAGVLGSLDADPDLVSLRGASFWYVTAGVALAWAGAVTARSERRTGRPGEGFGAFMAVVGLWGVVLSPLSGFWLFLPIAALARRNRTDAAPQPSVS